MVKKSKAFPLDFNDSDWAFEDAVPAIFLGDSAPSQRLRLSPDLISYLLNEGGGKALAAELGKERVTNIANLHGFLMNDVFMRSLPDREKAYSPIVWCRIAIQFWLKHGARQEAFMLAMTKWVRTQNKGGVAFVVYPCASTGKKRRMPMEAFLFGGDELPDLMATEWEYKQKTVRPPQSNVKSPSLKGRTERDQVGTNLLAAVRAAVAELVKGKKNETLLFRRQDRKKGKYRYRGRREDLLNEICLQGAGVKGKWTFRNGGGGPYATSALLKTISRVAICRRSWLK